MSEKLCNLKMSGGSGHKCLLLQGGDTVDFKPTDGYGWIYEVNNAKACKFHTKNMSQNAMYFTNGTDTGSTSFTGEGGTIDADGTHHITLPSIYINILFFY